MRFGARAFFLALPVLALASCDYWIGNSLTTPAGSGLYQALPLKLFLTRPTIEADAMQFCRMAQCGYDAAVERITATGSDARALHDSLQDPQALGRIIGTKPKPIVTIGGKSKPVVAARVEVAPLAFGDWKGVAVTLSGGPKQRHAHGIVVEKADGARSSFIVVVASSPTIAQRLAEAATRD